MRTRPLLARWRYLELTPIRPLYGITRLARSTLDFRLPLGHLLSGLAKRISRSDLGRITEVVELRRLLAGACPYRSGGDHIGRLPAGWSMPHRCVVTNLRSMPLCRATDGSAVIHERPPR